MDCEDSDFEFEQTDEKNFFFLQKYASEEWTKIKLCYVTSK
jgi:hypothetical protein